MQTKAYALHIHNLSTAWHENNKEKKKQTTSKKVCTNCCPTLEHRHRADVDTEILIHALTELLDVNLRHKACDTELLIHALIGTPGSESQTQGRLQTQSLCFMHCSELLKVNLGHRADCGHRAFNSCTGQNYWM